MNTWEYQGDCDLLSYGGSFARHVGGRRFHVVRFDNMDEACGSDNEGYPTYNGTLGEVDLDNAEVEAAISCCGDEDETYADIRLAFMVASYGGAAPLVDESSNNGNKLVAKLKRMSRELEGDAEHHEELMNRPVNAIGSTAREYARGDFQSAIDRSLRSGNEAAGIMAIMSRPRQAVQLGRLEQNGTITGAVSVDMSLTGSDDPIAFSYGFSQGMRGEAIHEDDDLAAEYVRGHAEGLKVFNGGEVPSFAKVG